MSPDRGSAVVLLSGMLTLAVIGLASVAYVVVLPILHALTHALAVLPH